MGGPVRLRALKKAASVLTGGHQVQRGSALCERAHLQYGK